MLVMTAAAATRRLVLVPAAPRAERGDAAVRRYRLARSGSRAARSPVPSASST